MSNHEKLNYVEFGSRDILATKQFFSDTFGWEFVDYGPDYISFSDQGLNGGFFKTDTVSNTDLGGALLVFYSKDIKSTQSKIELSKGSVKRSIFEFPGGCRFHFTEPGGNEFAVWSEGIV